MKHCSKKTKGQRSSNERIAFKREHSITVESSTQELKSQKIMAYSNFSLPFVVHCDGSEKRLELYLIRNKMKKLKLLVTLPTPYSPLKKIAICTVVN